MLSHSWRGAFHTALAAPSPPPPRSPPPSPPHRATSSSTTAALAGSYYTTALAAPPIFPAAIATTLTYVSTSAQVMLFSHSPAVGHTGAVAQPPLSLSKFTHLRTSLDNEDQTATMRQVTPTLALSLSHTLTLTLPPHHSPPPSLSRSTFTRTHLPPIRQGFDTFLGKVAVGMAEKSKAEMEASLAQA